MKNLYTLLLLATISLSYSPAIATDQHQEISSKRQVTYFVEDLTKDIAQEYPGRLYRPAQVISDEDSKILQKILSTFDASKPQEFIYHKGMIKCLVTALSAVPQQLIADTNISGKLFNYSVPSTPLRAGTFPKEYDFVIRYHADDGRDHYINARLSNNQFVQKN